MGKSSVAPVSFHVAVDTPSTLLNPLRPPLGPAACLGRSSKWIQFLQGLSQHCPPHTCCFFTPKAVPFSLPVPSLQPPQASPPHTPPRTPQHQPASHIPRPTAEIRKKRKMVARSAWRTPRPPGISPSGLVSLGCSGPSVPDSTSAGPKPRPTSCPALPEMGSDGPTAGLFGCGPRGQHPPACFRPGVERNCSLHLWPQFP